jgi:hypothetical protein
MAANPPARVIDAVARVQRALRRAANLPLPADATFFQITNGQIAARVAATVAELEIPDVVRDRSVPVREIAACIDVDLAALQRLLKAAAATDLVTIDHRTGDVRLTKQGQVLRTDHPSSMRNWAILTASPGMVDMWGGLTESVRSGRSPFRDVHGTSLTDWLDEDTERATAFASGMRDVAHASATAIANAYPWPARGTVCDVGGDGVLLAAILDLRPDLSGTVVDGKKALDRARDVLTTAGVAARVAFVDSNIDEDFEVDADVYLLKDVLHTRDDDECRRILGRVEATMNTGSALVIAEVVDRVNEPSPMDPFVDLMMFAQTDGGRQRTVDEWTSLLREVGLTPSERTRPAIVHTVIDAARRARP